jgi:hypothetical protein
MNRRLNLSARLVPSYEDGAEWPRLIARSLCLVGVHDEIYYPADDESRCWWCSAHLGDGLPVWAEGEGT